MMISSSSFRIGAFVAHSSANNEQQSMFSNSDFPKSKSGYHTSPVSVTSNKYLDHVYAPHHFEQFGNIRDVRYHDDSGYHDKFGDSYGNQDHKMSSHMGTPPYQGLFKQQNSYRLGPPTRPSAAGSPYNQPTERQNLVHSASHMVGNNRFQLPHPPMVNEHTIVFMVCFFHFSFLLLVYCITHIQVQFKMEYRYFVLSPLMTDSVGLDSFVLVEAEKGADLGLVAEVLSMETYIDRRMKEKRSGQFEEDERVLRYILKIADREDLQLLGEKCHDENNAVAVSAFSLIQLFSPLT